MGTVELTTEASASADAVWEVLADFAGFLNWAGDGSIRTEGTGVGMVRHLDMPGVGEMAEHLDQLDHASKTIGYSLVYGTPAGMAEYRAVVTVRPTGAESCSLEWCGEFTAAAGHEDAEVDANLRAAYEGMTQGLAAYIHAA